MKQLVEDIAKALVDIPEAVSVRVVEGELATVFELKVAASDLGKVIGRQGRMARAEARARQARRPREEFVRADPATTMLVSNPRARPCP